MSWNSHFSCFEILKYASCWYYYFIMTKNMNIRGKLRFILFIFIYKNKNESVRTSGNGKEPTKANWQNLGTLKCMYAGENIRSISVRMIRHERTCSINMSTSTTISRKTLSENRSNEKSWIYRIIRKPLILSALVYSIRNVSYPNWFEISKELVISMVYYI